MKLKGKIFIRKIGSDHFAMMIDGIQDGSNKMIRCNDSSILILDMLQNETTIEEIVKAFVDKYDIDVETATQDVVSVIDSLEKAGYIV